MIYSIKARTRKEILGKLKEHTKEEKSYKSDVIKTKLFSSKDFKKAHVVMFYVSKEEEVSTHYMLDDALEDGKKVVIPYITGEAKEIIASELKGAITDLELGPYGILQPRKDSSPEEFPLEKIDLVIVPGVAFDEQNNRLGRGKGYYDRFLRKLPPGTETIGLCFDFQIVGYLPQESHDFPVSRVITN
ncbi:MAG: 5-formyltetrahydrofolate cyclo-ligase [Candidatus Omnitrophica bacterium]|nr:5-formyltetrahydrofolate cyclo-ligase [Candidatus Omnitrophota bacterium]